ncbi:hypothetical protein RMATCC62417_05204 [Rhizopus microsporus]|nr:hypothetical protein RMATCC62417_05204 [Rhizopus microsporus]
MQTIYTHQFDDTYSSEEKQVVNLLKYIMSDYHANYEKPAYYTDTNKCTLYSEYIIPIFKYFNALYKNILFMWCEKGLMANKHLTICLSDEQKKMMDRIGYSLKDKTERLIIECSG